MNTNNNLRQRRTTQSSPSLSPSPKQNEVKTQNLFQSESTQNKEIKTINELIKENILNAVNTYEGNDSNHMLEFSINGIEYKIDPRDVISNEVYDKNEQINNWCLLYSNSDNFDKQSVIFYTMLHVGTLFSLFRHSPDISQMKNPKNSKLIDIDKDLIFLNPSYIEYKPNEKPSDTQEPHPITFMKNVEFKKTIQINNAITKEFFINLGGTLFIIPFVFVSTFNLMLYLLKNSKIENETAIETSYRNSFIEEQSNLWFIPNCLTVASTFLGLILFYVGYRL